MSTFDTISLSSESLTGIAAIDEQHQSWCNHYRALVEAIKGGEGADEVAQAFTFLVNYTVEHFAAEEKCMTANCYPGTLVHRQEHDKLIRELSGLLEEFSQHGSVDTVTRGLANFMDAWFRTHIGRVDMALGQFLKKKGITDL